MIDTAMEQHVRALARKQFKLGITGNPYEPATKEWLYWDSEMTRLEIEKFSEEIKSERA